MPATLAVSLNELKARFIAERNGEADFQAATAGQPAQRLYVNLNVSPTLGGDPQGALNERLQQFIASPTDKVFLLQGNAGAGKSLFVRRLAYDLWQAWSPQNQNPVPLLISLPLYWRRLNDLVTNYLQEEGFTPDQIRQLRAAPFKKIFIFDSYDEVNCQENLYQANSLRNWTNTQAIITCRSHYLGTNYVAKFAPRTAGGMQVNAFKEGFISPFSIPQQSEYIQRFAASAENQAQWTATAYTEKLANFPTLQEMDKEPFSLGLILRIFPTLPTAPLANPLTRYDIYERFVEEWFRKESQQISLPELMQGLNLGAHQNNPQDYALEVFQRFSQELALWMFKQRSVIASSNLPWFAALFEGDEIHIRKNRIGLKGGPLKALPQNGKTFIHKSFMEYFVAKSICREIGNCVGFLLDNQKKELQTILDHSKILAKCHMPHRDVDRAITNFVADKVRFSTPLQEVLFRIIDLSKEPAAQGGAACAIAAANAVTFLNYAKVNLNGKNFSRARLPKADLSQAVCERTNFDEADLREANFSQSWLREATFNQAKMGLSEFGELASFKRQGWPIWISPDGQRCAFYTNINREISIYVFETGARQYLLTLPEVPKNYHCAILLDSAGNLCVTLSGNGMRIWNLQTSNELPCHFLAQLPQGVEAKRICLSPNGRQLAISTWRYRENENEPTIRSHFEYLHLWDIFNNREVWRAQYAGDTQYFYFSHDGGKIAGVGNPFGTADHPNIYIWNTQQGAELQRWTMPNEYMSCGAFSPDGRYFAVVSHSQMRLLDTTTQQEVWKISQNFSIRHLCFSLNGDFLIGAEGRNFGGLGNRKICLYEATTGYFKKNIGVHTRDVEIIKAPTNGNHILSADNDGMIRFWTLNATTPPRSINTQLPAQKVKVSPCGRYVVTLAGEGTGDICLWEWSTSLATTKMLWKRRLPSAYYTAEFNPTGSLLAIGDNQSIHFVNVNTGNIQRSLRLEAQVSQFCFSLDGRILIAFSNNHSIGAVYTALQNRTPIIGTLWWWDVDTGTLIRSLPGGGPLFALSPDGHMLVTESTSGALAAWNVATGERIWQAVNYFSPTAITFTEGGANLLCCFWPLNKRYLLRRYDAQTGTFVNGQPVQLQQIPSNEKIYRYQSVVFSPNKRHIFATLSYVLGGNTQDYESLSNAVWHRESLVILSTETGEVLQNLAEITGDPILSFDYSPDGQFLVTNGGTGYRLWSLNANGLIAGLVYATDPKSLHLERTSFQGAIVSPQHIPLIRQRNRESEAITNRGTFHLPPRPPTPVLLPANDLLDIDRLERERLPKCWRADLSHIPRALHSYKIHLNEGEVYRLIPASDEDYIKVRALYNERPVPGFEINTVHVIYNPAFEKGFKAHIKIFNERLQRQAFRPNWKHGYKLEICRQGVPPDARVRANPRTVYLYRHQNSFAYKVYGQGSQNVTNHLLGNLSPTEHREFIVLFPPQNRPITRRMIDSLSSLTAQNSHPLRDLHFQRREQIIEDINNRAQPYQDHEAPGITFLPLWHGANRQHLQSIYSTGYANLATTDAGYYGKGIYGTIEPQYAYKYPLNIPDNERVLLLNWVAFHSAYPVVDNEDKDRLYGRPNYANHDAHVAPVANQNPNDPNDMEYLPVGLNRPAMYTEVVVFDSPSCLPRYEVTLRRQP